MISYLEFDKQRHSQVLHNFDKALELDTDFPEVNWYMSLSFKALYTEYLLLTVKILENKTFN